MPPGTQPTPRHFPIRNRIIASLELGVLVIEAAKRSGSLITAREAGERGGEVMVVPGSPLDGRTEGCNHLIREGAMLVRDIADILECLLQGRPWPAHRPQKSGAMPAYHLAQKRKLRQVVPESLQPLAPRRPTLTKLSADVTNRSQRFWWRSSNWNLPAASAAIMATVFAASRMLALQTEFQAPALTNHKFHTICGVLSVRTVHETRHRRIAGKGKDHQSLPW